MALQFLGNIPFVTSLGLELLRFEAGESEIALAPRPEQMNSWGVLHGGVTMTLMDVAMAQAARAPTPGAAPDPRGVVTVEMKTSFMGPGVGRVLARGRLLRRTSTLAFCEASLFDADEVLIAHATGTFKYLAALPVGGRRLKRLNASD